jgi:hypothetical protein
VGESLGDFRLLAELGRSSHARVFLAAQPTLADRSVVLKVTPRQDRECLADALQHAHERGLVHLDLKPSNVLLAADGQPLLLDFHLALHPVAAGQVAPEGMGGTLEYMSPEQRVAFAAARREEPVPAAVDCRSDIYSLGRTLAIALGGKGDAVLSSLHRINPQVSVGLEDIIRRCLARDPEQRYSTAAALAADLRAHLAGLPLRGVANRSIREGWTKWRRRRPHAFLWASALLALAAIPAAVGIAVVERFHDAREALREGQEEIHQRAFSEAARTLARGKARVQGLPGTASLVAQLDEALEQAHRASAAGQLHAVTERLRLLAGRACPGAVCECWKSIAVPPGRQGTSSPVH